MIVRGGTGFGRAFKQYVLGNWALVLTVLVVSRAIPWVAEYTDVLQTDVFSATAIGLLATVVGIFIVFRFNEAYQRWWEALKRELVHRRLAYCNALRLSLRGQDTCDELAPFLSAEELNELKSYANKPTQLNRTQGERLARSLGLDTPQQLVLMRFDARLSALYDIQGGCERIKNTAFPDQVRFISQSLVWLGAIAVPIAFLGTDQEIQVMEALAVIVISLSFMVVEQLGESEIPPPIEPIAGVLM